MTTSLEITSWLDLIKAEYMEMPGLRLTRAQAQRLWGLDPTVCEALLESLVEVKFLARTQDGHYYRLQEGPSPRSYVLS